MDGILQGGKEVIVNTNIPVKSGVVNISGKESDDLKKEQKAPG